jgi:hypothetical protein
MDGRIYRGGKPGSATDASTLGAAARQCSRCCDARRTVGPCTVGACTERCTVGACTERERAAGPRERLRHSLLELVAPYVTFGDDGSDSYGSCDKRRRGTTSSKTISSNFHTIPRKLGVVAFSLQARLVTFSDPKCVFVSAFCVEPTYQLKQRHPAASKHFSGHVLVAFAVSQVVASGPCRVKPCPFLVGPVLRNIGCCSLPVLAWPGFLPDWLLLCVGPTGLA